MPEETDNSDLLQKMGKTPGEARDTLEEWGVIDEQRAAIIDGAPVVFDDYLQSGLRRDIVIAEAVIAAG